MQFLLLGEQQKDKDLFLRFGGEKLRPIVLANSSATNTTNTVSNKVKTVGTGFIELN